jgi:hypothetical protein
VIDSTAKPILAAAALLLLAGCGTYGAPPPQGPYGETAPAPYPYPGDQPYPGNTPIPPPLPPGAYPGGPYQPQPPECPITASREWSAWVNAMPGPGARPALVVRGKVVTPTGGYQVAFDRYMQIRRGQPPQAFVTLYVAPPSGGAASQAASTHEVRWEWPLNQPVGSVVVRCGDKTLAEITNIQTAY